MRSELGPAEEMAGGLRAEIFSIKNLRKLSQRMSEGTTGELSQGFTWELKMLKRTFNSIQFNSIQFSFNYIEPNYNKCHLKALK